MKNYPYLKSIINKNNRVYKILTLLFLFVTIVGIIASAIIDGRPLPDPQPLNNAIIDEIDNQWSYIDVEIMSDYFAAYEEDDIEVHRYYFVWDDQYLYIALLDTTTFYDDLQEIYDYSFTEEDIPAPNAVRITGMSEEISEDLKAIAIEQLNEWYGEGYITEDIFADVVGNYLLNVKETPNTISGVPFMIGIVSFFMFITFGIIVIVFNIQNKKGFQTIPSDDIYQIEEQIQNGSTYYIHGVDVYLTKNYIVDLTAKFQAYAYDNICWLYLYRIKQYGITTSVAIKVGLTNGKIKTIGTVSRKYENDIMNVMLEAVNYCNPQVMVGYSKENKKAFKEIKKNQ